MTEEQKKAIKVLERAFKKCRKMGLNFASLDENVYAFIASKIGGGGYEILTAAINNDSEYILKVDTDCAFIDSGGW